MPLAHQPSPAELLDVLTKRRSLLGSIDDGVTEKRELEASLDCSRSTLNRGVRELEAAGLLARPRADLELTLAGEVALDAFSNLLEPLADAVPLLDHVADDAPFDTDLLRGGSVVESAVPTPDAPVNALAGLLDDADRVRAVVPTRSSAYVRVFAERVDDFERAEIVLAETCLNSAPAAADSSLDAILTAERCSVETVRDRPPYSLVVADDSRLWVGIYDAQGKVVGAIVNDEPAALDWARSVYRQFTSDHVPAAECDAASD